MPELRPDLVQRRHLIERLNKYFNRKLTLISAPAGFGKTTLLIEWVSQMKIPVAWLSLDKSDNDPVYFLRYFIASLQTIEPNIGKTILSVLQSPHRPTIESIMKSLIKEISEIPNDIVLVLDDYHSIDTEVIHNMLELILNYLPVYTHLVIATRVDPPLSLARLRVSNQLSELRTTDLSFTKSEMTLFFNERMNLKLSSYDISILESRTEGWIAGLQLAALSMQGYENIPSFIKTFAGNDRYVVDYLVEEVLNRQPVQIQEFLLKTSILNRLSAPLCDFVLNETGSQTILDMLENINLFIVPLDNKRHWYRYHHLFAELLQQRLHQRQKNSVVELHSRASNWYEQNKYGDDAVEHALAAKDFEQAVCLIEEQADMIWERGEHNKFKRWLKELPAELVFSKPILSIIQAESLLLQWHIDEAEQSLQIAERSIISGTDDSTEALSIEPDYLHCSDKMKMLGRIEANRSLSASFREDISGIIQHAHQALEYLPERELTWRSTVAITLGDAHSIKGDMSAAYQTQLEALELTKNSGNKFLFLIANANLAVTLRQQGKLKRVLEICKEQVRIANESGMSQTIVVGWLMAIWGEVLAELNDLDGAFDKARIGVEVTERCGDVGMLCKSYLCLIRVYFSRGNMADAEEFIEKLENIDRKSDLTTIIKSKIAAWKARILLVQNKLEAASQVLRMPGVDEDEKLQVTREFEYIVIARIYNIQGRCDEAIDLLDPMIKRAEAGDRITILIEMLVVKALILKTQGDTANALTIVGKALSIAKSGGFIRIFIDEGPPMVELLEKNLNANISVPKTYVKKLLSAFRLNKLIQADNGLVEQLTEREMEVLRLIAAGLSNKRIEKELFISMSTVKTHIRNIYSKLGVNSRTKATVAAKELDLL